MNYDEIIKKMTLEEKVSLLCGESFFGSRNISEYGINRLQFLDGGTGMNFEQLFGDLYRDYAIEHGFTSVELDNATRFFFEEEKLSPREKELRDEIYSMMSDRLNGAPISPACFPPGIFLGSSWNRDLIRKTGRALGMEALLYGVECLLGTPNINLLRDPRNGRFFEGYSEDPFLTGELGSELVKGVESEGVASNVKHFAANNLEFNRSGINQIISKRALMELYLPHFKKCLDAKAATIMTSYPSINGTPCVDDPWLLRKLLRDEWKYEGVNMTDWGAATGDCGKSLDAGIDLFMPGPWPSDDILLAVKEGRLSEERIDEACSRMIEFARKYSRSGMDFPYTYEEYMEFTSSVCDETAKEGIVMLKNDNNLFPVNSDFETFILFGPDDIRICGGGSAQVFTDRKDKFSEVFTNLRVEDYDAFSNLKDAVAIVVCSIDSREGVDRLSLDMDDKTKGILNKLIELKKSGANGRIALILNTPGPVVLGDYFDDIDSIFAIYYPGSSGVKILKDMLYGKVNPSGKLTCTWPVKITDMPSYEHYPDGFKSYYGEGIFVGYRGYEKKEISVLFPFGFGLSYSDFKISDVTLNHEEFYSGDEVKVRFKLKNTGNRSGKEVVQIYVGDPYSRKNKAIKELRAFGKYELIAGEEKEFELGFNIDDLKAFDEDYDKFLLEDGIYRIYIGTSSVDIIETKDIRVMDGDEEYRLGLNTPIRELMAVPEIYEALKSEISQKGLDEISLIMAERYTPSDTLNKIYENAEILTDFVSMCTLYKKS